MTRTSQPGISPSRKPAGFGDEGRGEAREIGGVTKGGEDSSENSSDNEEEVLEESKETAGADKEDSDEDKYDLFERAVPIDEAKVVKRLKTSSVTMMSYSIVRKRKFP